LSVAAVEALSTPLGLVTGRAAAHRLDVVSDIRPNRLRRTPSTTCISIPMNIVLATHNLDVGGIGTLTRGLASALPDAISANDHLTLAGYCPDSARRANVSCAPGGPILKRRLGRHLFEQVRLPVAARRADLVHLLEPRPLVASRHPFVLTLHDVFVLDHPEWYPRWFGRVKRTLLRAAIARRPRVIVCDSEYTRDRLLAQHRPASGVRVEVIYPGVVTSTSAEGPPENDQPYFLTVSTIEPRKNHTLLLEAFRRARSRGLSLTWKVAGGAGYSSKPIIANLRSEPGVDLLGRVSDAERDRLYRGALFCAFPSHAEGFGFPPLEAMTFGCPVVCSTGSALDETIGDASLRVSSDNVDGWADALCTLESDETQRAQLAEAGRGRAARFAWRDTAARYLNCYRAAIGN
jgi:glycosyltransferase involved in cell wall biosynthesis